MSLKRRQPKVPETSYVHFSDRWAWETNGGPITIADSGKERRETGAVRIRAQPVCVDAGNTIFMLMLRASGSVFKLCKSNINAKPVINNFSASREDIRG